MDERLAPRGWCRTVRPAKTDEYKLFISYRQSETSAECALLSHLLSAKFGDENVFLDTEKFDPGEPFPERIRAEVVDADAVLLVIGPQWLDMPHIDGGRRIDHEDDWVRQEIQLAKGTGRLIPVLVQGAEMPQRPDLPDAIQWIAFRQAVELRPRALRHDANHLVERLEKPNPGVRFVHRGELRRLAASRWALLRNAVTKPCSIALAILIALVGAVRHEFLLFAIAAASFLLLSGITYFTLAEAEWVGSRHAVGNEPIESDSSQAPVEGP